MQYSTFAAIDIGSYDVILEIFEISKKQGIRSVDKICHRMELGKDTYTLGKIRPEMEEELCRVLADFVRIMEGYRVDDYRATASSAISEASKRSLCPWKNSSVDRSFCHGSLQLGAAFS